MCCLVGRVRRVEVDVPGTGKAAIGKSAVGAKIIGGQNHVAQQPARLALAGDIRRPGQLVVRIQLVHVLERVPGAIHRPQIQVPHPLHIGDRIPVKAALPEPLPQTLQAGPGSTVRPRSCRPGKILVAQIHRPGAARKGRGLFGLGHDAVQRIGVLALATREWLGRAGVLDIATGCLRPCAASRVISKSAPARNPTSPSPVQSANQRAARRRRRRCARAAPPRHGSRRPCASTALTRCSSSNVMLGSARTIASLRSSS